MSYRATHRLTAAVDLAAPRDELFDFFSRAENLETLTPGWLRFSITSPTPIAMGEGTLIDYRLRVRGLPLRWRSEITAWQPPELFVDTQLRGPYRVWVHEHRFTPVDGGTRCEDRVGFAVPGGRLVVRLVVARDLERIFAHRHRALAERFGALGGSGGGSGGGELRIEPV